MTLYDMWDEFIAHKRTYTRPSTVCAYRFLWASISHYFGPMEVNSISTKAVEKWCIEQLQRLSKKSIKDRLILINNILDFAEYEHDIPVSKIKIKYIRWPKSAETLSPLESNDTYSPEELRRIVVYAAANPSPVNLLVSVMIATGIRIGEACALTFGDFDVATGSIIVSKTLERIKYFNDEELLDENNLATMDIRIISKSKNSALLLGQPKSKSGFRSIPLPKELAKVLKGFKALLPDNYFLGTHRPVPEEPRVFRSHYRDLVLNKVGLKRCLKPHAIRHTFASLLVTSGTDVRTVSELLGHADVTTTLTVYSHASTDSKRKAIGKTLGRQFGQLNDGKKKGGEK